MLAPAIDPVTEPPALAALLVQPPRRLASTGAYATMLDLVARGVLVKDDVARTIAAPRPHPAGLAPFEKHVFDAVTARAPGGSGPVPLGAIDLGTHKQAELWNERFATLVGEAGLARGLVRPRAPLGVRVGLWSVFTIGWVGAATALVVADRALLIFWVIVAARLISLPFRGLKRLVPVGRGAQLAAHAADLRTLGPAYAVAVGGATGESPFAEGKGRFAWSRRDGNWRRIRIVDGPGLTFGWSPGMALLSIVGILVFLGPWLVLLWYFTKDLNWQLIWPPVAVGAGWAVWVLGIGFTVRLAYRAVFDLTHPVRVIVGPVIHLDTTVDDENNTSAYAAVDDGSDLAVRYAIGVGLLYSLRKDMWLRLEVTPKLGHVRSAEIVEQ